MRKRLILAILFFVLLFAGPALAFPRPGHYVYGVVTVDGLSVAEGTIVTAQVKGVTFSSPVDEEGRYGYSPNTLCIRADDLGTPETEGGNDGDLVTFQVAGRSAYLHLIEEDSWSTAVAFESGALTHIELVVGNTSQTEHAVCLPWIVQ